jgi:hypothetical protein
MVPGVYIKEHLQFGIQMTEIWILRLGIYRLRRWYSYHVLIHTEELFVVHQVSSLESTFISNCDSEWYVFI